MVQCQPATKASLSGPPAARGLECDLLFEAFLQDGQLLDQTFEGDSLIGCVLPALLHQLVNLPNVDSVIELLLRRKYEID